MKAATSLLGALAMVCCTVVVCAPGARAAGPSVADQLKTAELGRFAAMMKSDLEALDKVLADDLRYTHSSGAFQNKAQYIDSLKTGAAVYHRIDSLELDAQVVGTTAILTGRAKMTLSSKGEEKVYEIRYTDVWLKRKGRWQMAAWQATRLP